MTPKQLEELKKSLAGEKKLIEKELSEIGQKNPKTEGDFDVRFPQYGQSKDENAQEVTEFEKMKILEANLEKKLGEINKTLKKIGEDAYGICQNCSAEIEMPRLKAMPTASLCAVCVKKN
ncbi:MAG: TraR/DksA family transcriptional regulator [Patescibacteria group bacterium]